eukprot:scaffold2730_cov247-Pinguiococcus_pyrenoidosus.AAC.20
MLTHPIATSNFVGSEAPQVLCEALCVFGRQESRSDKEAVAFLGNVQVLLWQRPAVRRSIVTHDTQALCKRKLWRQKERGTQPV